MINSISQSVGGGVKKNTSSLRTGLISPVKSYKAVKAVYMLLNDVSLGNVR